MGCKTQDPVDVMLVLSICPIHISHFASWALRGHEGEVPAFVPQDHGPLFTLGKRPPKHAYSKLERVLSGLNLVLFGFRF